MKASEDACLNLRHLEQYVKSKNRWRPSRMKQTDEVPGKSDCLA